MDFETLKAGIIKGVKEQPWIAIAGVVVLVALLIILVASSGPSRAEIEKRVWTARTILTEVAETRRAVAALHWFAAETAKRPTPQRDELVADLAGLLDATVQACAGLNAAHDQLLEAVGESMMREMLGPRMLCEAQDMLGQGVRILVRNPNEKPASLPNETFLGAPAPDYGNSQPWSNFLFIREADQLWLRDFASDKSDTSAAVWAGQNPGNADPEALEKLIVRANASRDLAHRSYDRARKALVTGINREIVPLCTAEGAKLAEPLVAAFSAALEERMLNVAEVSELDRWADAISVDQETSPPGGLFQPSRLGMSMRHTSITVISPRDAVADSSAKTRVELGTALLVEPILRPAAPPGEPARRAEAMERAYADFVASR